MPALAIVIYSGLEKRQRSIENAQQEVLLLTHALAETQQELRLSAVEMFYAPLVEDFHHSFNRVKGFF